MTVVYLTNDLMFLSRATGAGAQAGITVRGVRSSDELLGQVEAGGTDLILVDLSLPQLDLAALMNRLHGLEVQAPRVVAYAPHVHVERLKAARQAGCDQVLTRGQFNKRLDQILAGGGQVD
jgi:CheY-like chemotaxis protein